MKRMSTIYISGAVARHLITVIFVLAAAVRSWSQIAPASPDFAWHPPQERMLGAETRKLTSHVLPPSATSFYSLPELIDFAESHNPHTRLEWEKARASAEALGVARSALYPVLSAVALSQTARSEAYLATRYYRLTLQSFDFAMDLNYTIFDFGERSGRIDVAKAQLLAANFDFNDTHRLLIYQVQTGYYQLLNAAGQVEAARANVANAQAVQQSAEASLKNGLATLPDVLEARSATARAAFDFQAALGAESVAQGNLAETLGIAPQPIPVESVDQLSIPDQFEVSLDEAIDRAAGQRPDMLRQVAEIRSARGRVREARAAFFPTLKLHAYPDAQSLYGLEQQYPWGHSSDLDGQVTFDLRWTVFDGGARKHSLAQARDNVKAAQAQAEATREQIENGVWTAYSDLKTAFRQREAATAFLQAASQSYQAALESYHYGVRNLLDVTEAQKTLAQARSADVLARTQVLTSLAAFAFETADSIQTKTPRSRP